MDVFSDEFVHSTHNREPQRVDGVVDHRQNEHSVASSSHKKDTKRHTRNGSQRGGAAADADASLSSSEVYNEPGAFGGAVTGAIGGAVGGCQCNKYMLATAAMVILVIAIALFVWRHFKTKKGAQSKQQPKAQLNFSKQPERTAAS
jgi:hypothetical protein